MTIVLTTENAVSELVRRIPAFQKARSSDSSFLSHDDGSPYLVFGDFGRFLLTHMNGERPELHEGLLKNAFQFVDEMLTSSNPELINLAHVGVLEVLADSPDVFDLAKKYMSQRARQEMEQLEKWYL